MVGLLKKMDNPAFFLTTSETAFNSASTVSNKPAYKTNKEFSNWKK